MANANYQNFEYELSNLLRDSLAQQLIQQPRQQPVITTSSSYSWWVNDSEPISISALDQSIDEHLGKKKKKKKKESVKEMNHRCLQNKD